jgi:hypothetical protein
MSAFYDRRDLLLRTFSHRLTHESRARTPQASRLSFGGYAYSGDGNVQDLFVPLKAQPNDGAPLVEQANSQGAFSAARFSCPVVGPCLRLGAYPAEDSCAMGVTVDQPLLASTNGGTSWHPSGVPDGLDACFPGGTMALSRSAELVFSSTGVIGAAGELPALYTVNGGRSWEVVSLPALPSLPNGQGPPMPNLVPLPTGGVLDYDQPDLLMLPPGSSHWCSVAGPPAMTAAAKQAVAYSFTVVDNRIWWLTSTVSGSVTRTGAYEADAGSLTCG